MDLRSVWKKPKPAGLPLSGPSREPPTGLAGVLRTGLRLPSHRETSLRQALEEGVALHDSINEKRLELALSSFEPAMRHALYETLFLLHVNDPRLGEWQFVPENPASDGSAKRIEPEQTASLYVESAPCGVQGIDRLSSHFRDDFLTHIRSVFQMELGSRGEGHEPIVSVHSIGSTGTIGHKPGASDLDLQVVYSLEPFTYDTAGLGDESLRDALRREYATLMREIGTAKKLTRDQMQDPLVQKMLQGTAAGELGKLYPNLNKYLVRREGEYAQDFAQSGGEALRIQCLHEVINLLKRAQKTQQAKALAEGEKLLRERIARIQDYLKRRFPTAEVYLFPMSIDAYRMGHYSSTLEFKESSGSAYELILNHDTLMAGIQFTPVVPSHFVFPQEVNNNAALYARLSDYIRFGSMRVYDEAKGRLVNLGATPDLTQEYIARHTGAAYWEAFKASSGNLPKSTLNLLRYEMLLDPRFLKTVIQLVKEPGLLDGYVSRRSSPAPGSRAEPVAAMPTSGLLELEALFPVLRRDPWWLRYKALKIAFAEAEGIRGLEWAERLSASGVIDLAFALHCRISDVFTKPGDRRVFETIREQVLLDYLARSFPPGSPQRTQVEQIFIGEVNAVNTFEEALRTQFKRSLGRVLDKVASLNLKDEGGNREEFAVWYHYYQANFDPLPNMVRRSIMQALKVPRGRVQLGYESGTGWIFRSLQRLSGVGKRFDTFGMLDHLPDTVTLLEHPSFLHGLAHCILNGYYGVMNRGTLKQYQTALEFDGTRLDLGHPVHNTMAFLRPDQVSRILHLINEHFRYQDYDYLDVVRAERRFTEVMIFLNLWVFGRISILSRDNLRGWYVHEYDHPELIKDAKTFNRSPEAMLTWPGFQRTLGSHFDAHKVLLSEAKLATWVNPNSVETSHAAGQVALKEGELSRQFEQIVRERHGG